MPNLLLPLPSIAGICAYMYNCPPPLYNGTLFLSKAKSANRPPYPKIGIKISVAVDSSAQPNNPPVVLYFMDSAIDWFKNPTNDPHFLFFLDFLNRLFALPVQCNIKSATI